MKVFVLISPINIWSEVFIFFSSLLLVFSFNTPPFFICFITLPISHIASLTFTPLCRFHHFQPSASPLALIQQMKCLNYICERLVFSLIACTTLITTWIWLVWAHIKHAFCLNELDTEQYYTGLSTRAVFTWSWLCFTVWKASAPHTHF